MAADPGWTLTGPATVTLGEMATVSGTLGRRAEYGTLKWTMPSGRVRGLAAQHFTPFEATTPEVVSEAGTHRIELYDPKHGPGWGQLKATHTFNAAT